MHSLSIEILDRRKQKNQKGKKMFFLWFSLTVLFVVVGTCSRTRFNVDAYALYTYQQKKTPETFYYSKKKYVEKNHSRRNKLRSSGVNQRAVIFFFLSFLYDHFFHVVFYEGMFFHTRAVRVFFNGVDLMISVFHCK